MGTLFGLATTSRNRELFLVIAGAICPPGRTCCFQVIVSSGQGRGRQPASLRDGDDKLNLGPNLPFGNADKSRCGRAPQRRLSYLSKNSPGLTDSYLGRIAGHGRARKADAHLFA